MIDGPEWAASLEVVTADPPNAGTPVVEQTGARLPVSGVYVRSNFPVPALDVSSWKLLVGSAELTLDDIKRYQEQTLSLLMECAGNGRTLMEPVPSGTPWTLGGASHTSFTGVSLRDVLHDHLDLAEAAEVVFTGSDAGEVPDDGHVPYQFSLTAAEAQEPDPILAWAMDDMPLTPEHGWPLRLVVPGQYAMKSVKWLSSIEATGEPFMGHFVKKYRYYGDGSEPEGSPVGRIQIRSMIASPQDGAALAAGECVISGSAWSDGSRIKSVAVSIDGGQTWAEARVEPASGRFSPAAWSIALDLEPGEHEIAALATDIEGRSQPVKPRWNRNGYGNNVVHRVTVEVK